MARQIPQPAAIGICGNRAMGRAVDAFAQRPAISRPGSVRARQNAHQAGGVHQARAFILGNTPNQAEASIQIESGGILVSSCNAIAQPLVAAPLDLTLHAIGYRSGEMVIEMELAFAGRLDESLLSLAVDLLLDAEPVLGCRLVIDESQARWELVSTGSRRGLTLTSCVEEYEGTRRTGLDATANVQIAVCLWRCEEGDRLLVKMTHEVGDGVGLQLLASRLASIYTELCNDITYRPRPNAQAQRDFDQVLSRVPKRAYPRILWDFVRFMAPRWFPRATHRLLLPSDSVGPWAPVVKRVPARFFSHLSTYAKARGATLNDMFLAAAYRALASYGNWDGSSGLRISITVDLRRWCLPDRARSICNLSVAEYPFLIRNLGRDFEETLANVAALTRRRKKSRPGLASALLYDLFVKRGRDERTGSDDSKRLIEKARNSPGPWESLSCVLSNEGALDKLGLQFGSEAPVSMHILPPFLALPGMHLSFSSFHGAFTLAAVTPENGRSVVEGFLDALIEELPLGVESDRTHLHEESCVHCDLTAATTATSVTHLSR